MMLAGVIFSGAIGVLNLLLFALLARRLRQLAAAQPKGLPSRPWLPPGSPVGQFTTTTVSGDRISTESLSGRETLVAFFSTGCKPCHEQLPAFAAHISEHRAAADVLAVVVGPVTGPDEFSEALDGKARLVREKQRGPVSSAFGTHVYPAIYRIGPGGRVLASGPSVAVLTRPPAGPGAAETPHHPHRVANGTVLAADGQ